MVAAGARGLHPPSKGFAMSDVTPYIFENHQVRVVTINGEPWWVAADVCAVLKLANPRDVVSRLHSDDVGQTDVHSPSRGQNRPTNIINESGLYELIIRSDKPEARKFRRWVTRDVLPQIRKTGGYSQTLDPLDQAQMMLDAMRADRARIAALETTVVAISAKQAAQDGAHDWFTTLAYAKLNGLPTDRVSCQKHGQRAARLMRSRGQEPIRRQDATFGTVNTYPVDVLEETVDLRFEVDES